MRHSGRSMHALAAIWCAAAVFCFSRQALAHRVNIFAAEENGKIVTESYSSSGKKCKDAKISVFDGSGILLLEGTTDGEGKFSFDVPGKGTLRIVLDAGTGHRAEYTLSVGEGSSDSAVEREEVGAARERHSIRLRDVIGGLGWIVGIMGIVMYLRSRKSGQG